MTWAMPLYEVRYSEEDEWIEISDVELVDQLYRYFNKVTPVIKEMIAGREVRTAHGIYRLKLRGGEQPEKPAA